jgi:hypothetical protein
VELIFCNILLEVLWKYGVLVMEVFLSNRMWPFKINQQEITLKNSMAKRSCEPNLE